MNWDRATKERMGKEIGESIAIRIAKMFALGFGMLFFFLIFGFLLAWLIQYLWNSTLATMFDWTPISYWQGFGLLILAKIFFGFGMGGGNGKDHWKKKADEKPREPCATPDEATPADDAFKKYWREEGRAAYEAYLASQRNKDGGQE